MSVLREYTNEKHRAAEATPFVQYMLHGNITLNDYAVYLQQMELVYRNIEYFAEISHLLHDLPDIKRSDYMREDLKELGFSVAEKPMSSISKWCERIVYLYYTDKSKILAHVYVRHMGDMYGGKIIAKKVPGSGKAYGFADRPALIKALDAKLSTDLVDEALTAFDLAIEFFNELEEKLRDRRTLDGS